MLPHLSIEVSFSNIPVPIVAHQGHLVGNNKLDFELVISCDRGHGKYPVDCLSLGERQTFNIALILDFLKGLPDVSISLFVDEPEMNLEPKLANHVWSVVEESLDRVPIIYTTHSLDFALRPSIQEIYHVTTPEARPVVIPSLRLLGGDAISMFLGTVRVVTTERQLLVVEGSSSDASEMTFDETFYGWLLADNPEIVIKSIGSRSEVHKSAFFKALSDLFVPSFQVVAVHDRDFTPGPSTDCGSSSLVVMPLSNYDAEAYLCDPTLLHSLVKELGLESHLPSEKDIKDWIIAWASDNLDETCLDATNARFNRPLCDPIHKNVLLKASEDDIRKRFESHFKSQSRTPDSMTRDAYKLFFDARADRKDAIDKRDLVRIRQLFRGKTLVNHLAKKLGLGDANTIIRGCKKHLVATEFNQLLELRTQILGAFDSSQ